MGNDGSSFSPSRQVPWMWAGVSHWDLGSISTAESLSWLIQDPFFLLSRHAHHHMEVLATGFKPMMALHRCQCCMLLNWTQTPIVVQQETSPWFHVDPVKDGVQCHSVLSSWPLLCRAWEEQNEEEGRRGGEGREGGRREKGKEEEGETDGEIPKVSCCPSPSCSSPQAAGHVSEEVLGLPPRSATPVPPRGPSEGGREATGWAQITARTWQVAVEDLLHYVCRRS